MLAETSVTKKRSNQILGRNWPKEFTAKASSDGLADPHVETVWITRGWCERREHHGHRRSHRSNKSWSEVPYLPAKLSTAQQTRCTGGCTWWEVEGCGHTKHCRWMEQVHVQEDGAGPLRVCSARPTVRLGKETPARGRSAALAGLRAGQSVPHQ